MKKQSILIAIAIILGLGQSCSSSKIQPEITPDELYDHIEYLASDSLKGRYPGTPEDKLAADYIAAELKNGGLELLFNKGVQSFEITTSIKTGPNNSLSINDQEFNLNTDFIPTVFSANSNIEAEVAFVGYGFIIEQGDNSWNDYASIDVKDKWVLILRGEPENSEISLPFSMFSSLRSKAITAKDQGAAGVIFVSGKQFDEEDELIKLSRPEGEIEIPVIQIKRNIGDILLSKKGENLEEIENELNNKLNSFFTETVLRCQTDIETGYAKTFNIVAQLIINPDYKYIVVGGHYDHLGFGGPGTGTRAHGIHEVHYGADDNASGVASMLEIAEKLATKKDSLKNNFLFVAFGAEEMGLIGSKYFVNNLPIPDSVIKTMINVDMLGRMKEDRSIQISGIGTSLEGESILDSLNTNYNFKTGYAHEGYGPSDHSSFYSKDIPVFFFSTGAHIDYHTPGDSLGNINFTGLVEASNYIYDFAFTIASEDRVLTYQEAGPKSPGGNIRNARLKVSLGIMPDFSGVEKNGLRADIVIKGKPADKAGMKTGDIITAIDGYPVGDVYEYMERLAKLKAGQIITVEVIRDEKKEVLIVQL
ncbi:MAG: M20/M25/M40 family metallo-hydrolase [Bacteroidales bacterium]|nr:M20/M25/M40 family metallo-hydrolase [Bacteroidales bacterium]